MSVITMPLAGTKAVTVLAMFPVGSRYEDKKLSGASHFVEHMMFKGTTKRPDYLEISRELDAAGAEFNAFTYKDYTGYYIKISSAKLDLAFDLLDDMVYHSVFSAEEIEKEKGVIVEEIRMYEDNPTMAVDLLFDRVMFGNHPLGRDIAGTAQSVRALSRADLWNYYKKHYVPKNMILAVAGNFQPAALKKYLKCFADEKATGSNALEFKKFAWPGAGGTGSAGAKIPLANKIELSQRKVDQAHVILGFPGLKYTHPDRYAEAVLLTILGGGMSSRLFVEVREKRGLAYMVRAGSASFKDVGAVAVQAGLDPSRLHDALKVIKSEIIKIQKDLVSAKELADAKTNIAGKLDLAMEDSSAQSQWFARQFLFGDKMETYEEFIKNVKKVTAGEVRRVAQKILDLKQMKMAIVGPDDKAKITKLFAYVCE